MKEAEVKKMIAQIAASFQENWQAALEAAAFGAAGEAGIGRRQLEAYLAEMYPPHFAANVANEVFRTLDPTRSGALSVEEARDKVSAIAYRFIKDVLNDFHRRYGYALLRFGDDDRHFSRAELCRLLDNWGIPRAIAADVLDCIFAGLEAEGADRIAWSDARLQVPYFYLHYYR